MCIISSLKSSLPGETWRTLLQTFRTKIFLALSDDYSAKIASELCGKEDQLKISYNLSESGHDTHISFLTGKAQSNKANLTTSKTYYQQSDYRFDMKTFTELRNAQSVTIAYDGLNPMPTTQTSLISGRRQTGSCESEQSLPPRGPGSQVRVNSNLSWRAKKSQNCWAIFMSRPCNVGH
jgi:hypothetical protein